MGATPDQLKADIERTRSELASDVNSLADRVSPSQVVRRRTDAVRSGMTSMKERVMGSVSDTTDQATSTASDLAGSATDAVRSAPSTLRNEAQGNPLAAGLIAFGAGLLTAALIPPSRTEQDLALQVKDSASDLAQPVADAARQSAHEVAEHLKPAAQDAVEDVRSTAAQAASTTTDQARSAAQDVASTTRDQAQQVAGTAAQQAQQVSGSTQGRQPGWPDDDVTRQMP